MKQKMQKIEKCEIDYKDFDNHSINSVVPDLSRSN